MMRTAFGLMTVLSLGVLACSSKAVDDDDDGKAGSAAGGMASGTAGKSSGGADTSGTGGVVGRSGSTGTSGATTTGGTDTGLCTDTAVVCVDADTASLCDPLTGETETANCKDAFAEDGLISSGCTTDDTGSGCTLDGLADADCEAGTPAFAVCQDLTQDDLINVYVNCFHDTDMIARQVVTCYTDYIDEAAMEVDCAAADAACLPAE